MNSENLFSKKKYWETSPLTTSEGHLKRVQFCVDAIPQDIESLLDVGCGNGLFLSKMEQITTGKIIQGCEQSMGAIEGKICQSDIKQASIDTMPFESNSFDIVSAFEVIEHINFNSYKKSLQEIERVARKYIIISVPNKEKLVNVKCPYCYCEFNACGHLRIFDHDKLKNLFENFEIIKLQPIYAYIYWGFKLFAPIRSYINKAFPKQRFPINAICPQCNYRNSTNYDLNNDLNKDQNISNNLNNNINISRGNNSRSSFSLHNIWPQVRRSNWLLGLYQKK